MELYKIWTKRLQEIDNRNHPKSCNITSFTIRATINHVNSELKIVWRAWEELYSFCIFLMIFSYYLFKKMLYKKEKVWRAAYERTSFMKEE